MEKQEQQLNFVCKLCDKRYPSGKSLGGHMRSHVVSKFSVDSEEKCEPNTKKLSSFFGGAAEAALNGEPRIVELGGGGGGSGSGSGSGYGLRENPKKTWRAVVGPTFHPSSAAQEKVCKQCGKGFKSLKALCGHMACHSDKEKAIKDDHSWTTSSENQDSSDSDVEDLKPKKRSKNKKGKKFAVKSSSFPTANCSSSVSEIDEQEQEEVAMSLMMLSRDFSGNWVRGLNSMFESSDNNSVVLETKSSSIDMGFGGNEALNYDYDNDDETPPQMTKLRNRKLKSGAVDAEMLQVGDSDSEYFMDGGAKKVEPDVYAEGYFKNCVYRKPRIAELRKLQNKTPYEAELKSNIGYEETSIGFKSLRKSMIVHASYDTQFLGESFKKAPQSNSDVECLKKCNKTQALAGDKPRHKKPISEEFSVVSAERRVKSKKSKGHECPICLRIFKSGQALGGHKRSHFIGASEDPRNQFLVVKQQLPDLLDLNLPAPNDDDDEAEGNDQFLPW